MAPVKVATVSSSTTMTLSKEELRQIDEYGKIIGFRERVLSGKHPTIKVPAHLLAAKASRASPTTVSPPSSVPTDGPPNAAAAAPAISSFHVKPSAASKAAGAAENSSHASQAKSMQPPLATNLPGLGSLPKGQGASSTAGSAKPFGSARAEIDPIFLQKSDHLIKTELQLQRQRIERTLREQLEQRRGASWSLQPSDPLPNFDLMDVLQQALLLAQKTASSHTDGNLAANHSDDANSLDGNAYASTHIDDSPNSNHLARLPSGSGPDDTEMRDSPDYDPELGFLSEPATAPIGGVPVVPKPQYAPPPPQQHAAVGVDRDPQSAYAVSQHPPSPRVHGPALGRNPAPALAGSPAYTQTLHVVSSGDSADTSGSVEPSGNTDNEQSTDDLNARSAASARLGAAFKASGSTVVRAHNLSPLAPQPSHVSPLALSRIPQPGVAQDGQPLRATPAQIVAIRNEASAASSPDSSPQAAKPSEKRKGKKKGKRKADRQVVDTTPYIKPEPRSPSPVSTLPAGRPHKRLRSSHRSMEHINYEEQPSHFVRSDAYRDQPGAPAYGEEPTRVIYERRDVPRHAGAASVISRTAHPYDVDVYEVRRPPTSQYIRSHESVAPRVAHYAGEKRIRSVSHTLVEHPSYREGPVYYRDVRDESRLSVRPGVDPDPARSPPTMREARPATMAPPPRVQQTRIIVDEFGREYIEPTRPPTVLRQSVAPGTPGDALVYEPTRAPSRVLDAYGEGIVYKRVLSPRYAAPRRNVTEPEYATAEHRAYDQDGYFVVPSSAPAGEEYSRARPPPERRVVEDFPHEYIARAASVRPMEPVRYGMGSVHGQRNGSVRPDFPAREYAASVRPESRHEVIYQQHPYMREYSARPETLIQRPYSVWPTESTQFQYERPVRAEDDVAYIERPRGLPENAAYGEVPPREIYR